jgi:general secretion pathway protein B
MSFILDALRKSETQRQRTAAPTLADTHYHARKKSHNVWIPILVVILTVNIAVITFMLFNPSSETDDTGMRDDSTSARVVREIPLRSFDSATTEEPQPVPTRELTPGAELIPVLGSKPATAATKVEPVVAPPEPDPIVLPTLRQLVQSGQVSVAPLRIDIHVYSDDPAARFVFINMRQYKEREALDEGPMLEEITSTGVILSYHGNRFNLERE